MLILKILFAVGASFVFAWLLSARPVGHRPAGPVHEQPLVLSEQLLYAIKTEQPTDHIESQLANYSAADLLRSLGNDKARKTFWINLYNAHYQLLAQQKKTESAPNLFGKGHPVF